MPKLFKSALVVVLKKKGCCNLMDGLGLRTSSYFFFWAFCAAFVVVPETSLAVVDLITPTATVCLMSLTAKRPRGGNSEKASTHMGLEGTNSTMAASPDLMDLGLDSVAWNGKKS